MKRLLEAGLGVMFLSVVSTADISASAENISSPPVAPAAEKAAPPMVTFSSGLLSVTAKDADIRALVESIGVKSGVEIVLDTSITGKVTAEFQNMEFEVGLKRILNDVVVGGFSSEYIQGDAVNKTIMLSKIVIARLGPKTTDAAQKPIVRISDIKVQDVMGQEIVFAKWGTGPNEIPLMTEEIDGQVFRKGFAKMRVGDDGTIYFVNWAHHKIYVYDKDGNQKKPIEVSLMGHGFDVDHEGNIYVFLDNRFGPSDYGQVYAYSSDGMLRDKVIIPMSLAVFSPMAVIDDGIMRDKQYNGLVYDFRKYLTHPERHSDRRRYMPGMRETHHHTDETNYNLGWESRLEWARNLESDSQEHMAKDGWKPDFAWEDSVSLPKDTLDVRYPTGWRHGDDHTHPLGIDKRGRLYLLLSTENGLGIRFYNNYNILVVDSEKKTGDYYRLKEVDNFVYEKGRLWANWERFDVDNAGNVYQLFTTKEGVHLYKYSLGEQQ